MLGRIMQTRKKDLAACMVAGNWRIRKRLPRITAYCVKYGFLTKSQARVGSFTNI